MDRSEQWLTDGDCNICRRRKYCGKECKAARTATRRQIGNLATKIMIDCMRESGKRSHDARVASTE